MLNKIQVLEESREFWGGRECALSQYEDLNNERFSTVDFDEFIERFCANILERKWQLDKQHEDFLRNSAKILSFELNHIVTSYVADMNITFAKMIEYCDDVVSIALRHRHKGLDMDGKKSALSELLSRCDMWCDTCACEIDSIVDAFKSVDNEIVDDLVGAIDKRIAESKKRNKVIYRKE